MGWRKGYLGSYHRTQSPSGLCDTLERNIPCAPCSLDLRGSGFIRWSQRLRRLLAPRFRPERAPSMARTRRTDSLSFKLEHTCHIRTGPNTTSALRHASHQPYPIACRVALWCPTTPCLQKPRCQIFRASYWITASTSYATVKPHSRNLASSPLYPKVSFRRCQIPRLGGASIMEERISRSFSLPSMLHQKSVHRLPPSR